MFLRLEAILRSFCHEPLISGALIRDIGTCCPNCWNGRKSPAHEYRTAVSRRSACITEFVSYSARTEILRDLES
jgi:hypothetical protein